MILVRSATVKHLKILRIISSKMKISLLILSWWYFSCLPIQIFFYFHMSFKCFFQIFVSKVYRSVVLENKSLWTVDIIFVNKLEISWRIYFNILTQSEEWEQSNYLVLKNKTTEKFQLLWFSLNLLKIFETSCYSLLNMKVIWLYYLVLINPYKFMSGYLYFPKT